ncbi:MAG TPA: hypothetical protein VLE53_19000 [Gemmatimonadaceae bacterium]|nr:hypothetical protein [Gemmatimonadaceae bacterium]
MRRCALASALALAATACDRPVAHAPPTASFLIEAGDSTFWTVSRGGRTHVRRAPLLLAQLDGRFHELYVTDDDHSFFDAILVGQRVYRRDLLRGDSLAVFQDTTIAAIASVYAASHPNDRRLAPDEEAADDPANVATTDTEIVHVLGPFAVIEQHLDVELASGEDRHLTRRFVIDLRAGRPVALAELVPDSLRAEILRAGRAAFATMRDSVERSDDHRARAAARLLSDFEFDSTSFSLVITEDSKPALAFLAPGSGRDAGGSALPLPPIEIPPGTWWNEIARTLPTTTSEEQDVWDAAGESNPKGTRPPGYDVVVQYDSFAASALLLLRDASGEEWPIGPVPVPVWRVHRLDAPPIDAASRRSLTRAFDEAARYSDAPRATASLDVEPTVRGVASVARATQRPSVPAIPHQP